MQAVVILLLDVSGSMGERERQISKTFFFWAIQGLRRQYRHLDLVFVAHTSEAWEFQEEEFFRVTGTGGTVASAGLKKVREIIDARFSPSQYNVYLFYASDGENFPSDQPQAQAALEELVGRLQLRRLPRSRAARRRRAGQRDRQAVRGSRARRRQRRRLPRQRHRRHLERRAALLQPAAGKR